jgi:phosphoribosylformimino-5-aminoimidazole carboxamide ribotide isomerase
MITIIPAIDIIDGKCVRLTRGDYEAKKIYNNDPVEIAKQFEASGFKRLHLVDLDGAKAGSVQNLKVLEQIASATNLTIDFSGGISSKEIVTEVFESGAAIISIGSMAVKQPGTLVEWITEFGSEKFMLAADVKDEDIVVRGWTETTSITIFQLIDKFSRCDLKNIFCTDISKDGMMQGPSIQLYKNIFSEFPDVNLIASGGVSNIADIEQLDSIGCSGVIIGKAFYEGLIKPEELKKYVD